MLSQSLTSQTSSFQPIARVAVVLSTHNRAAALRITLEQLACQRAVTAEWRVLAIDNASSDGTPDVLAEFEDDKRFQLVALNEPRPGKARALNRALNCIDEDLVVFTDDDVDRGPDWLAAHITAAARWPSYGIFGGPITPLFPEDAPDWVQDERYVRQSPMFARYAPREDEGLTTDIPLGPNMAIRRAVIAEHRFDELLGPGGEKGLMNDETEFELRLARLGHTPFVYVPEAAVSHQVRPEQMTVDAVWKRAYRWGRGMALTEGVSRRGPFLLGVPLRYWFGSLRALLRFAPFRLGPQHFRLKYGWQWHVRAGRLRGYLDNRHSARDQPR